MKVHLFPFSRTKTLICNPFKLAIRLFYCSIQENWAYGSDLIRPSETNSVHPASTIIDNPAQRTSSAPQHQNSGVSATVAPIPDLHDLPPQYTRDGNATSSTPSGISHTTATNQTVDTNSNDSTPEVGILRNIGGEGSEDYEQGLEYYYGKGVPIDYNVAKEWFIEAADHGHVAARYYLAYMLENGQGFFEDSSGAVSRYIEAGSTGYDNDECNARYHRGKLAKALHWYREAADKGDARAQCVLGFMYHRGRGTLNDQRSAKEWYKKAADQGYDNAQYNLGLMWEECDGTADDYTEAAELYFRAVFQGHARAQCNLGDMHAFGRGVCENESKAAEWYAKSADQGYDRAQCRLAEACIDGIGIPVNFPKGVELLHKLAAQGYAQAQVMLGNLYFTGRGVRRNTNTAKE
ncbi:hypothetical protein BGZ80_005070 [Entomortierella chlamydospora]|uniref:Chitin synthase activator n=1 Tax=Entomortierella chlamydospora TaxID=101097 RepID=A0A9P6T288_9FUNG|nr:hypothetical protein BGZ80_005070 [Entomortierella chlamydospora]